LAFRLPEDGDVVGDYRIVEKCGEGGYGTVYKAERAGCFYAVKFIRGRLLEGWARRENAILLHLEHPNVVRCVGSGYWPAPAIGHPYLVMEYVEGASLEEFVQAENPSARRSARIVLDIALTLGEVHRQGVLHRDLKPENILIRAGSGRPVLVDFGVGALLGAPTVTSAGLPPGTYEFRAPEAWRFKRENANTEVRYPYGPRDELWALGVMFYWLLTDVLPFGNREDEEAGGLVERILLQTPLAPHVLNSRVPRALSDLCMKMLEKAPSARCASVEEFCAALDAAIVAAALDASWDLPLFEPDAPDSRTTDEDPARVDVDDSMRWLQRWLKEKRRRGQRLPEKPPAPAPVPDSLLTVEASPVPAVPPAPVEPPASDAGRFLTGGGFFPVRAMALHLLKRPSLLLGLLVVLGGVALFVRPAATSTEAAATWHAGTGHEVAPPLKPLDPPAGESAEPATGSLSAPVMMTMPPNDDTRGSQKKQPKVLGHATRLIGTTGLCAALAGCPASQVRPALKPQACPAGAEEAMKEKLGVEIEDLVAVMITPGGFSEITVQEGPISVELGPHRDRDGGGIFLSGTLTLRENRVYGRFTQARIEKGQPFPVCFELRDYINFKRGSARLRPGSPDTAHIYSTQRVDAVRSFE
jgi:serine/threonine-protein kinase